MKHALLIAAIAASSINLSANAASFALTITGQVENDYYWKKYSNYFGNDRNFTYTVKLEEDNKIGNAQWAGEGKLDYVNANYGSFQGVYEFSGSLGTYNFSGKGGTYFIRNGADYDQISLGHNIEETYKNNFHTPGRTDFISTDGDVAGFPLLGVSFYFRGETDFMETAAFKSALFTKVATNYDFLNKARMRISFDDRASEYTDIPLYINISSMQVSTSEVPVPAAAWLFGSALLGLAGLRRRNQ